MNRLKVGVIGATGGIGQRRCEYFSENPSSEVVAVCARREEEVRAIASQFGARWFTRWEELLAHPDIEAVDVATINATHYSMARAALEAGKHTCVEYPLAQSVEQYDELFALAQEKKVILHDALTVRFEALHEALRNNLPHIGEPVWAHYRYYGGSPGSWYAEPQLRGNPFIALHIHFIEQQRDLLGEPEWVQATLWEKSEGGNRVSGNIMLGFSRNVTGYIEFGMGFCAKPSYQITYLGSDGFLEFNQGKLHLHTADSTKEVIVGENRALQLDTDNFVAQVLSGAEPLSPPSVGRRAIELCLAATRSVEDNRRVTV